MKSTAVATGAAHQSRINGEVSMKSMRKIGSRRLGLAAALLVGIAFSGTASAWTFEHGWSCQNKWYQMGLIELIACGGGGEG
nr:hypothetical protein [Pseudomonas sp.]